MLVSATLHSNLGTVAAELLNDPVAVGLQLQRDEEGAVVLAEDGPAEGSFQLPKSLQQLYMEVPVKMRLPSLLGAYGPAAALESFFPEPCMRFLLPFHALPWPR